MATGKKPKPSKVKSYSQCPTLNILRSANLTAVPARKKLTLHTPTRERTEPSPLLDLFQCLKPLESKIKEPQERTLKVSQRKILSAKQTMLKVDLEPVENALRLKYALLTQISEVEEASNSELPPNEL